MLKEEFDRLLGEKKELEERLLAARIEIEEATTGQTSSEHKWAVDSNHIEVIQNGGGNVLLTASDLCDALMALSLHDEGAVLEALSPFGLDTPPEPEAGHLTPEADLGQFVEIYGKSDLSGSSYFRVREQNKGDKHMKAVPGQVRLDEPNLVGAVLKKLSRASKEFVILEFMNRPRPGAQTGMVDKLTIRDTRVLSRPKKKS